MYLDPVTCFFVVRLCEDKLGLVQRALESSSVAYKKTQKVGTYSDLSVDNMSSPFMTDVLSLNVLDSSSIYFITSVGIRQTRKKRKSSYLHS